jgi:hypothetical protein
MALLDVSAAVPSTPRDLIRFVARMRELPDG